MQAFNKEDVPKAIKVWHRDDRIDQIYADLLSDLMASDVDGDFASYQRFVDEGASTFNARADYTHTNTLPNHTCMMTGRPVCVGPDQTTEECMALMTDKRIRHLPVAEGGRVVGLVSIGDLVKASLEEKDFVIKQLKKYIKGDQ